MDTSKRGGGFSPSWSPDSRWIAYTSRLKSWYSAVFVYSLEESKIQQVTDGMSDAVSRVVRQERQVPLLHASTDIGPRSSASICRAIRTARHAQRLRLRAAKRSAVAARARKRRREGRRKTKAGRGWRKEGRSARQPHRRRQAGDKKEPPKVTIDFDNIGQRILALPIPARTTSVWRRARRARFSSRKLAARTGSTPARRSTSSTWRSASSTRCWITSAAFDISANGEKMLYRQGENWFIAATAQPLKPGEGTLKTDEMEVYVDPQAEWKQMYREVWRIERDFFYDPDYHGLDLEGDARRSTSRIWHRSRTAPT